jgi:hypothetical protein
MNTSTTYRNSFALLSALLMGTLLTACGGGQDPILGGDGAGLVPTVTAVAPSNGAASIAININIVTAAFSEPMAPITGAASFTLTCAAPCVGPTGSVALDDTGTVATFTLSGSLATNTVYTATVTGAESLGSGIALAEPFVWSFTTGLTADKTRPRVALTVPDTTSPGPTAGVPSNTAVIAVFSEDMAPTTIDTTSFTLTCSKSCVSPLGSVSYDVGSRTAVFKPATALMVGKTYTATLSTAATDLAGNALAGNQRALPAASDYVWTFTTVAALPPAHVSVISTNPSSGEVAVCSGAAINTSFKTASSLRMDPATLNSVTFTVTGPGPQFAPVTSASVALDPATGDIATFSPLKPLAEGVTYTVTIQGGNHGVKDLLTPANTMNKDFTWKFTTDSAKGVCQAQVNMGAAGSFAIAATAGIQNTPTAPHTMINGDVVLDPNQTCNAVSVPNNGGFGLCGGSAPTINGQVITNTFPNTTASAAIRHDLNAAFISITPPAGPPAAGKLAGGIALAAPTTLGNVAGSPLVLGDNYFTPGVYISGTSILISGDITLDAQGDPNAMFVFQSASTLTTADGSASPGPHTRILLVNGAKASNVWWQVGSSATIGTSSEFEGNVLAAFDITLKTHASSCGRLMAGAWVGGGGAFVFDSNLVSIPGNGCPP